MANKTNFTDEEKIGLTQEELKIGIKYLRKHKTAGALKEEEALQLYEMWMIGCSFTEMKTQYPQYEIGQMILTAALRKWGIDRQGMQTTLKDRVQAKVIKSVMDQVDFLTSMLEVTSAEHMVAMRDYILDPINNPRPNLRIQSIKEYKDIMESLQKLVAGTGSQKTSMLGALNAPAANKKKVISKKPATKELDLDDIEIDDGSN